MRYATEKQISYLRSLIEKAGFVSRVEALSAYGSQATSLCEISSFEASKMIDWLKSGDAKRYLSATEKDAAFDSMIRDAADYD